MKPWAAWGLAIAGIVAMALFFAPKAEMITQGRNDFTPLYVAAGLAPASNLYAPELYDQFTAEQFGVHSPNLFFSRLAFYALLLKPLSWLPYPAAYALWALLRLAAIVAFVWLWERNQRPYVAAAVCWSVPIVGALLNGQDATFLPLVLFGAYKLHRTRPVAAGALLSLCAIKYQLFLTLPLLFVRRGGLPLLKGFAAGAGVEILLSFVAAGPRWPLDYLRLLSDAEAMQVGVAGARAVMPNLHGLGLDAPLELSIAAIVFLATAFFAPRLTFGAAMAAVTAAGVLVSYHAFLADWSVIVFSCLMMWRYSGEDALSRMLALVLLTPVPAIFQIYGYPLAYAPASLLLICWALYLHAARSRQRPGVLSSAAECMDGANS